MIGFGKHFLGRPEETEAHVAEAMRLSPRDTMAYLWMTYLGIAINQLGRWEQAIPWFRRSIEANRNLPHAHFGLAAALAQLGRLEEAHSVVKTGLALDPAYVISRFRTNLAARSDNPTFLARLEPMLEGMRKAGVPEE
jgi:tetratricopeptide (TPR) repeat protein